MADADRPQDQELDTELDIQGWVAIRAGIVLSALALGILVGAIATVGLGRYTGDPAFARTQVFSVGALALGFGVLGWSGSILGGRGIENMQRHLETRSNWNEADSRRAMTRIAGFGTGVMLAISVLEAVS